MQMAKLAEWIVAGVIAAAPLAQAQQGGADEARIKRIVDGIVQPAMQADVIPGVGVGITLHGKHYFFGYGQATDDGAPFRADTEVEIGSVTKIFTTAMLVQAVNAAKMSLNDPAQKFMPDDRKLSMSAQRVTVGELADFRSGMPILAPNLPPRLEMRGIEHYTTKDFLNWICHWNAPDNLPAPYNYSNFSIGLVGYLVSDAMGQSWEELLRQWITGPLGMKDTMLRPGADQRRRLATGHTSYGTDAPEWPLYAWYAAGGLRSTVDDMLRFGDANLGHAATGGITVPPELIAALKLAHEQRYMLPNEKAAQALAWEVINPTGENGLAPLIVKSGGMAGFSCDFLLDPAEDAAAYIVMNQSNSNPQKLGIEIIRGLFAVSALADSQARIVRLSDVQGSVQIDQATGQGYEKAFLNMPIRQGMKLKTTTDARAEVEFEDGSVIHLTPDTVVQFTHLLLRDSGAKVSTVDIQQGQACFNFSGKKDDKFAVTFGQEKKVVATKEAPQALGPFSQAIKAGGFVFTAGQIAIDPATGKLIEGDVKAQTERVLKNLSAVLAAAGSSMDRIVKTTVFLKNMSDFPAMNEVYGQFFKNEPPARSTVQVVALAKDALIEIEAVALQ